MGIVENGLKWFESCLKNRKQVVDIEGSFSDERDIHCSILQGSILGPILFLCFINDFPLSTILKTFMFAEDTTCLLSGKNIDDLITIMNMEIDQRYYKLLGVYFDENLTFCKHIENTCAKLSKSLYFLKRARNFLSKKALTTYSVL